MKSFTICLRWFNISFACIFQWLMWCFCFLENSSFILIICLIFFFFLYYEEVEDAIRCRKYHSRLNLKMMSLFFYSFHIVWIFFMMNCRIVFIERCLRTFICVFKNVFNILTTYRKHFDIIDFSILLSVFSSAIDLYNDDFV